MGTFPKFNFTFKKMGMITFFPLFLFLSPKGENLLLQLNLGHTQFSNTRMYMY